MPYLRRNYKQKPAAWGSPSQVQSSIFKNAERMGVDPGSIALAMPFWFSNNNFLDYAQFLIGEGQGTLDYEKNQLNLTRHNVNSLSINSNSALAFDHNYTVVAEIELKVADVTSSYFIFDAHNGSSTGGYGVFVYQASVAAYKGTQLGFTNRSTRRYMDTETDPFIGNMSLGYAYDKATNSMDTYLNGKFRSNVVGTDNLVRYNTTPVIGTGATAPYVINAGYKALFIFKTKLLSSQIAHLSDNPYFLLHRQPSVFYSVPSGAGGVVTSFLDGKVIIRTASSVLLDGLATIKSSATNLLDGKALVTTSATDTYDGKAIIKSVATAVFDGKVTVKDVAINLLDGKVLIGADATNLLDGKGIIKSSATNLLDGKSFIKSGVTDLLDGKSIIKDSATVFVDGKAIIKDSVTNLFDGKGIVKSEATNLLDGKTLIKDSVTDILDGKIIVDVEGFATNLFDGKTVIKSVTTNYLDGLIVIGNAATNFLDGKTVIKSSAEFTFDGKVNIKDFAENLLDGKTIIKTNAVNTLDGKIIVKEVDIGLLDGKLIIQDDGTALLDGKVFISSGSETDVLDGKVVISIAINGKVSVSFSLAAPAVSFSLAAPNIDFSIK